MVTRARVAQRRRLLGVRSPLVSLPSAALLLAALPLTACSGGPAGEVEGIDCSVEDDYEFRIILPLELDTADLYWYGYGDSTPGAQRLDEPPTVPIPEGPRCNSSGALRLLTTGHKDWGAGYGEWATASVLSDGMVADPDPAAMAGATIGTGVDVREYDGISFWARAAGDGMSRGFMMTIQDRNTHPNGMVCREAGEAEIAAGTHTVNEAGMTVPIGAALPGPEDCGNGFMAVVTGYPQWHLHTIPFEAFIQTAQPNRVPAGVDRSGLFQFTINIPKDTNIDLWIDDLGVYRRRE